VRTQVRSLYRKLEASGRDEAIQHARSQGLL
jgi:DNA-binding CsgD family transcriptional regulator